MAAGRGGGLNLRKWKTSSKELLDKIYMAENDQTYDKPPFVAQRVQEDDQFMDNAQMGCQQAITRF